VAVPLLKGHIIMKQFNLKKPAALVLAIILAACSTTPKTTSLLDQTRSDYMQAQNNPNVETYARSEIKAAGEALDTANMAASHDDSDEKIDRLAYLAKQKIGVAQEVAKQKAAEAEAANAEKQRDQIQLSQRTMEANQAKITAAVALGAAAESQAHASQLEAQLADLSAKKTDRGIVITLSDVLFGTDQAILNPEGLRTVQKLADVLQQNPQRTVLVEGYTDSTGTASHNQELSERRAASVRNALQERGISPDRVAIRGYGQDYPLAANNTSENRQLNRRVEIVFSDDAGRISQR
jgi:outer membrane protein OmpA-like peptidoglycan-associated protein